MRCLISTIVVVLLCGCGVEVAGTAAGVAKLQAEQARQGKDALESVKAGLDAAAQGSRDNLKRAEKNGEE